MLDINDYRFSGISFTTYAFLTLTTGILAYATLAEDSGSSIASSSSSSDSESSPLNTITETLSNPSKIFEMNPTEVKPVEVSSAPPAVAQPMQGGKRKRSGRTYRNRNKTNGKSKTPRRK